MEKLPISLCVTTYNSEGRLKTLIERCRPFVSEVLVVDQKSTDGTAEDAKELADVFCSRRRKGAADPDRNWLFGLAKHPWVLYLDDDEYLSDKLIKVLPEILKDNIDIYWLKTTNLVDGIDIKDILGDDFHPRLFKKGFLTYQDQATNLDHTYPVAASNAKSAYIDYHIVHDRTYEKIVRSNRARDRIATPDQIKMQEAFITSLDKLLSNRKKIKDAKKVAKKKP